LFKGAESKNRTVKGRNAKHWHGIRRFDATRDGILKVGNMLWPRLYDYLLWAIKQGRPLTLDPDTGECYDRDGVQVDWEEPATLLPLTRPVPVAGMLPEGVRKDYVHIT